MKIVTLIIVSSAFVLLLSLIGFGQAKPISNETYYNAIDEAGSNTKEQIRKRVQIQRLYSNGESIATLTDTSEYLPPHKSRWTHIEDRGGVVKRFEVVTIGTAKYRKVNDGEWTKEASNSSGFGIGGGKDNSKREFFEESVKIGNERFRVLIEKKVNANRTYFDETRTWIDSKGRISKSISTTSQLDPKNIVSLVEVTYEYNLKRPKIEAPIK